MRRLMVADVEDGLCMAIQTVSRDIMQIDCGSQEGTDVAFGGLERVFQRFGYPDTFVLSHFHSDHYNGLFSDSINSSIWPPRLIKRVYYPRIPVFRERKEFFGMLHCMELRVLGSKTGSMASDLLQLIYDLNRGGFKRLPVSKGDKMVIGSSSFNVLWPPEEIFEEETISPIRKALEDAHAAIEKDELTKELYDYVQESGYFDGYFRAQDEERSNDPYDVGNQSHEPQRQFRKEELTRESPREVIYPSTRTIGYYFSGIWSLQK
jgi:hypothetical protein